MARDGILRQVIQCTKSFASETEGVFSHYASSEIFLTLKIQCCPIAKPLKSKTLLLHHQLSL